MSQWTYYRLHNDTDHVVGFMRELTVTVEGRPKTFHQWCDLRCHCWIWSPIWFDRKYKLAGPLPGMVYMKDPDDE